MGKLHKLVDKARQSQANLSFDDLCYLATRVGFIERKKGRGSHRIFSHGVYRAYMMNFQDNKGKASPYQIKQLLAFIEEHPDTIPNDEQ